MENNIKCKPIDFDNLHFDSTAEARWYIILKKECENGMKRNYKKVKMSYGIEYIPDFIGNIKGGKRLGNVVMEIKGVMDIDSLMKIETYAKENPNVIVLVLSSWIPTGNNLFELFKNASSEREKGNHFYKIYNLPKGVSGSLFELMGECCYLPVITKDNNLALACDVENWDYIDEQKTLIAYSKARKAQFK